MGQVGCSIAKGTAKGLIRVSKLQAYPVVGM